MGCLAPTPGFTSSGNAGRSRPCGLRGIANLKWVASASCFEIVGCCDGFSLCFRALTAVAAFMQKLRRKTMKKPCVKGRIGKTRRESPGYSLWVVVLMLLTKEVAAMARRAAGEGNIRKRKDGRWEGRYVVGRDPITGKMISRNVLGKTQA